MSSFPSDPLRFLGRPHTLSELEETRGHKPLVSMLGRIGLLLLIVLSLAMAAQLLVGAPH
jgi:hypothetical protein